MRHTRTHTRTYTHYQHTHTHTDTGTGTCVPLLCCHCNCVALWWLQEARTLEELQMLQLERGRILSYYSFMQQQAAATSAAKGAAFEQLMAQVQQEGDCAGAQQAAISMKQSVRDAQQLAAEQGIWELWSEQFARLGQLAAERFAREFGSDGG